MPKPVSKAVEPAPVVQRADPVVFIKVGDIADLRDRQASPAGTGGGSADLQRAKTRGEIAELRIGQMLVPEYQNRIGICGRSDVGDQAVA